MNTNEQELLNLYRDIHALRDDIRMADISNVEKIVAIKNAIDELHQIIAKLHPSGEVADAIDNVVFALEETIK